MARIVYGVSGEGSGHSSRATQIIRHLQSQGHDVQAVSYDRGARNLRDVCPVHETLGLHIASHDNKVSVPRTVLTNLIHLPGIFSHAADIRKKLFKEFQPHCVFCDFEPITAYLAWMSDVPLLSLDNQHRMRYMRHPIPPGLRRDAFFTRIVIRLMVPRPDASLITTFYFGSLTNDHCFTFPPILRREVLDTETSEDDHVLVYLSFGFDSFVHVMRQFPNQSFRVYGYDRDETDGNLQFRPFSKETFLTDLASSRAVIATAGFTTMTESLHFRKPLLAMPLAGQFEQDLNGILLAELGYGMNVRRPTREDLGEFLQRIPEFREKLTQYPVEDNAEIEAKIDELLENDAEPLRRFHARRKGEESEIATNLAS